jgi:hypothetical protein
MTAQAYVNGVKPKTKKALRDAIKGDPRSVSLYDLNMIGNKGTRRADEIVEGEKVSVVGPDAERDRKWYATVVMSNGKVKLQ